MYKYKTYNYAVQNEIVYNVHGLQNKPHTIYKTVNDPSSDGASYTLHGYMSYRHTIQLKI